MKRIFMGMCQVAVMLSVMSTSRVFAESTLPLQEQCATGAAHLVERLSGVVASTSHYNKKRDQCFARVGFYLGQVEERLELGNGKTITLKHPNWMVSLYRVFDDKLLGACAYIGTTKQECWIGDRKIETMEKFEVLLASYMDE